MAKAIRIICPNLKCRSILSVPNSARGKIVRCRMCGQRVRIGASAGSKPMPVAEVSPASKDDSK